MTTKRKTYYNRKPTKEMLKKATIAVILDGLHQGGAIDAGDTEYIKTVKTRLLAIYEFADIGLLPVEAKEKACASYDFETKKIKFEIYPEKITTAADLDRILTDATASIVNFMRIVQQ
ncbi:MAG: hypothetical protein MJ196_11645 [Treponemataceae bacterium]|nr:hypothetical protein [Treponemataceae bacterium]